MTDAIAWDHRWREAIKRAEWDWADYWHALLQGDTEATPPGHVPAEPFAPHPCLVPGCARAEAAYLSHYCVHHLASADYIKLEKEWPA